MIAGEFHAKSQRSAKPQRGPQHLRSDNLCASFWNFASQREI